MNEERENPYTRALLWPRCTKPLDGPCPPGCACARAAGELPTDEEVEAESKRVRDRYADGVALLTMETLPDAVRAEIEAAEEALDGCVCADLDPNGPGEPCEACLAATDRRFPSLLLEVVP